MASSAASAQILAILNQVIDEYGARLNIHGGSQVLVSDASIAKSVYSVTEPVRTPFGPLITVAAQHEPDASLVKDIPNASVKAADKLAMDFYTHAIFGINAEDPKYIYEGLKHTIYAMQPKGYAVVISLKQESKQVKEGGEEAFSVSLEDKLKYQSKGKINDMQDVLYFVGFERGRIRSFEKTATVDGKEVTAEVLLAMKWDQLTA